MMMKKSLEESCFICRLCRRRFTYDEMSEEHYPAKSTGNNDIVELDLVKLIDTFQSGIAQQKIKKQVELGHAVEDAAGKYFDEELTNTYIRKDAHLELFVDDAIHFLVNTMKHI